MPTPEITRVVLAAAVAAVAATSDLRTRIIPNRLVLPALLLGLLLGAASGPPWVGLAGAVTGAAVFGGPLVLFWLVMPEAAGAGDAKLGLALGALLGFPAAVSALLLGTATGTAFALALVAWHLARRVPEMVRAWRAQGPAALALAVHDPVWREPIPYGAFLGVGTLATCVFLLR